MICATEHDDIDRLKALRILWFRNIVEEASFISRHRFRMSFPTSSKTCDSIDVCHSFLFFFFYPRDERKNVPRVMRECRGAI